MVEEQRGVRAAAAPRRVAVIGAGMVGLATAWFLQERGVAVDVIDRRGPGAGSSWGNAGWLTPALTTPLPEPAVLRYGVRAVLDPRSPVYVPVTVRPGLCRFPGRLRPELHARPLADGDDRVPRGRRPGPGRVRRPPRRVGRLPPLHPRRPPTGRADLSPRVFAAGGHGMWGIVLGPLTGRLLAETVATGRAFGPLR